MSTTDIIFIFIFLPITIATYLIKTQWQKYILLLLSLFFYACGSPSYFALFLGVVVTNVLLGYAISVKNLGGGHMFDTFCQLFA